MSKCYLASRSERERESPGLTNANLAILIFFTSKETVITSERWELRLLMILTLAVVRIFLPAAADTMLAPASIWDVASESVFFDLLLCWCKGVWF